MLMSTIKRCAGIALLALVFTGCATRSPYEEVSDPLEPVNRVVYTFNDGLDRLVLKPVAKGYHNYVPATARTGVRNFFQNAYEPLTIVNQALQGKPREALNDSMRFGFNTIFGVFGVFDVATGWGLEMHREDFGQTFAVWGIGEGWFLMLPLLGPSNGRDAVGLWADLALDPVPYLTSDTVKQYSLYGLLLVSRRADLLSASKVLDSASVDPYLQVREAYRQKRWYDIHDGNPPDPDFFDDELFED